ncbi:tRNA threonylcarbamoyladenosine biosynthesis protein TsaE [Spiroplasma sp. TIUS-1]|uniref:tRNA (adenosine(37)-N6)-threonylcarbamoyltransferase complex ATPase subunit type 1 TsaE n=1 Tax=Spiroplasma sp. TIUS-1 TaxID=216963 RepID=UPI0013984283|nr:tRNA (adenosine(37)-N6)-threonylcarbamoyltransferase complex ATPase subunit type 1 TsaE [Spiroplasma sp. TIUS-1]QHX35704.1 tRNA threonylcarbamoyladenosine biosynthesis protein TsaE [Spiroplasma sp. TIUS-1]
MIVKLEQLNKIAKDLMKELEGNTFVLLNGDLGAGKTTFTKQLIKELGVTENVTSPSFNILNQYKTSNYVINHMDAYRLKKTDEIDMFLETFEGAINIIEWPNNLGIDFSKYGKVIEINILVIDEYNRDFKIKK